MPRKTKPRQAKRTTLRAPMLATIMASAALSAHAITVPTNASLVEKSGREGAITLPVGQYGLLEKPSQTVTGIIVREAWKVTDAETALELGDALTNQLIREGYEVAWRCASAECGGFDFRYGIETSPPPQFQVDITDFYYIDLRNDDGDIETLLTSNVNGQTYIQKTSIKEVKLRPEITAEVEASGPSVITQADQQPSNAPNAENPANAINTNPEVELQPTDNPSAISNNNSPAPAIISNNAQGEDMRVVLSSVIFDQGATTPSQFDTVQLGTIADRLRREPELKLYIVGHSDDVGSLSGNISITRARAAAVRQIFINEFNVPAGRILSDGVGFLSPIASNENPAGQALNRRVEAVFLAN